MQLLLLALTTQWGADESVPSRPFPSPRHHIPSLTHCTDFRKKFSGDSPPTPNNNMPTQKYISHGAVMAGLSFSVPLRSCRAVTVMGRTVTPDKGRDNHHSRPLIGLVWPEKTLMGQSRVGGAAQRSQCLLGNHSDCLSLPKVPNNTPPTTPSFFFFPSLVVHKPPSWVKGTGFYIKVSFWYSRVLFSWLTGENARSKNIFTQILWLRLFFFPLNLLILLFTPDSAVLHDQSSRQMGQQ